MDHPLLSNLKNIKGDSSSAKPYMIELTVILHFFGEALSFANVV